MDCKKFKKEIRRYYRKNRRDLPWKHTKNPYRILVSESMLQQTQVGRVIPFYRKFIKEFPDFETLAAAPTPRLLQVWQGLGYNRRALHLKKLAGIVVEKYQGKLPSDPETLRTLPGIGRGTAGAVAAFAFNKPVPFIETNIRRVFIHFFFTKAATKRHSHILQNVRMSSGVADSEILRLVEKTLPKKNAREWYYALMDYGAMLGRTAENANRRGKSYRRQPKFKGSDRELRGKLIRLLLQKKTLTEPAIQKELSESAGRVRRALHQLVREGFFVNKRGIIAL